MVWFVELFFLNSGTVIDQGEAPDFYFQKYPEENPALGFFTWRWVLTLGFDHMFSSPIFLGSLALLGASLMACTYTTQIPLVRVARRSDILVTYSLGKTFKEINFILLTLAFGLKNRDLLTCSAFSSLKSTTPWYCFACPFLTLFSCKYRVAL